MRVIGETRQTQPTGQMNKSLGLACANPDSYRESEHEAILATLKSVVHESGLTKVELIKRVFFGSQNGASFLVTFLRKKSNKLK